MTVLVFVDTNILVYALDASEPLKQEKAHAWLNKLWQQRTGRISFQVLREFYHTVTRKLNPGLPADEARGCVRDFLQWQPVGDSTKIHETAWQIEDRYGLSWWDAQIVAAAEATDCRILLSEDLQTGQIFDEITVINPFLTSPH